MCIGNGHIVSACKVTKLCACVILEIGEASALNTCSSSDDGAYIGVALVTLIIVLVPVVDQVKLW